MSPRIFLFLLFLSGLLVGGTPSAPAKAVTAKLVTAQDAVVPGEPFLVGVLETMEPGWHTYWLYPGAAGLPTTIDWKLPTGFSAGSIQWPLPKRSELSGILSYAYEKQVLLIVELTPPADLEPGETVVLQADVSWLACKEVCIPGSQSVELVLPVKPEANPANPNLFEEFLARVPQPMPPPVEVTREAGDQARMVQLAHTPANWQQVDFYPLPATGAAFSAAEVEKGEDGWTIRQPLPESIDPDQPLNGVIAVTLENGQRRGYELTATPLTPTAPADEASASNEQPAPAASPKAVSASKEVQEVVNVSIWWQLLLAFAGGLLLNIMPCVLPVLSLKILHFTEQAGQDRARIFQFGLAFTAGIFAWFMGLGVVSAIIKGGGSDVFWGTMFQNTGFTFALAVVAFVFALSLLGVYEMVLPGSLTTRLSGSGSGGGGLAGAFGNGFFATILGSACTAPMLGPAVGWAFTQDPSTILAIFFSIALGMSSPYLLLTANPGWMKWLPRPGAWMETFKQLMGFLLMPVVIWLVWVLGRQRGTEAMGWALAGLLSLGFLAWLIGRLQMTRGKTWIRVTGLAIALVIGVGTMTAAWNGIQHSERAALALDSRLPTLQASDWDEEIPWIPYSPEILSAAMTMDQPLFFDFTADWCLTCKWNEKTVLATREVREAMEAAEVLPIKFDFTDQDPTIGKMIQQYGRAGVPVYVVVPADRSQEVQVLPEFLTKEAVLEGLARLPQAPSRLAERAP